MDAGFVLWLGGVIVTVVVALIADAKLTKRYEENNDGQD